MSNELPDDPDQLKQYIEYLLDQNQFLDEELIESEKEKVELMEGTPSMKLQKTDRIESYSGAENKLDHVGEIAEELTKKDLAASERIFKAVLALKILSEIERYMKASKPEEWKENKEDHRSLEKKTREVVIYSLNLL